MHVSLEFSHVQSRVLVNRCQLQGDGFSSVGAQTAPLNLQWLVPKIDGANFLHYWATDSI